MPADPLVPLLDVAAVMARYGLRDRRAARSIMDAAGGFKAGRRLLVGADDLALWEAAQRAAREPAAVEGVPSSSRLAAPRRRPSRVGESLEDGFWELSA